MISHPLTSLVGHWSPNIKQPNSDVFGIDWCFINSKNPDKDIFGIIIRRSIWLSINMWETLFKSVSYHRKMSIRENSIWCFMRSRNGLSGWSRDEQSSFDCEHLILMACVLIKQGSHIARCLYDKDTFIPIFREGNTLKCVSFIILVWLVISKRNNPLLRILVKEEVYQYFLLYENPEES